MSANLKLVNLVYIPMAAMAHWLLQIFFVRAFELPPLTILVADALMIFAFAMRLSKRKIIQLPLLRPLIQISLWIFSFFSFYLPALLILLCLQIFMEPGVIGSSFAFLLSLFLTIQQVFSVKHPRWKEVLIPAPQGHPELKGFSFIHISDLHLGPSIGKNFLASVVQKIKEQGSPLVCITGDLIDGPENAYGECLEPLQELKHTHQVFFVTGNHEYYYDAELWTKRLNDYGVKVLREEIVAVDAGGVQLQMAGCDDTLFGSVSADFTKKLSEISGGSCIMLSHRPETWDLFKTLPVFLQLSGHGHGGQAYPWALVIRQVMKYAVGLFHENGKYLYVHAGTGFWGPPNRWLNPPEVCRIVFT